MAIDNKKMEEISKRFLDLPEDIQKALFSADTSDAIFEVGKKQGIGVDKMGELADETGLVMLGMTKPSEYIKNLAQRLSVEPEKAKAVAEDINQKVFATIRESLKKIHGITPTPTPPLVTPISPVRPLPPLPQKLPTPPPTLPVEQKVEKILHDHETAKQEKKETSYVFPAENEKIPPTSPILSGKIEEVSPPLQGGVGGGIPNLFVKKLPYQNNDPYKEPTK